MLTWRECGAYSCHGRVFGDVGRFTGCAPAIEGMGCDGRGRGVAYLPPDHVHYEHVSRLTRTGEV